MNFLNWFQLQESSLNDIFQSTVTAFPKTQKRQHATDTIKITQLNWMPFEGMKTLFVRALAQNEGREYNPVILFKKVQFNEGVTLTANNGKTYKVKPLSLEENDVLLRCQCGDFHWRGNYADHLDHSLYGKKRKKYESLGLRPPVNPNNDPMMCKHLIKMVKILKESGILV
jgi:hypothetical protein